MSNLTRRELLVRGSKVAVGTAIGIVTLESLAGWQQPEATPTPGTPTPVPLGTPTAVPPTSTSMTGWPWKYVKLDPQEAALRGYVGYYQAGCAFGVFNAIVSLLKEQVGAPYTYMPTEMARYGEGGGVGWATLCGALNGAAMAINLVTKDYSAVTNDLFSWYNKTAFPLYKPATPKVDISVTSVSNSPLCHISVTEWCTAAKVKSESPARSERCARLSADVALQTAQMLNDLADGKFKVNYVANPAVTTCGPCHLKGGTIENARGKMDCVQCHPTDKFPTTHPAVTVPTATAPK
ncbi:Split-Soret cytochrome c [Anaerolineae bacterium]|nr:Split-Soret cytochrome c [Anaerolineae bacterium]